MMKAWFQLCFALLPLRRDVKQDVLRHVVWMFLLLHQKLWNMWILQMKDLDVNCCTNTIKCVMLRGRNRFGCVYWYGTVFQLCLSVVSYSAVVLL